MTTKTITLDADQVETIRYALLVGLDSYGEIERVRDLITLLKRCDTTVPDDVVPIHPTGASDTIGRFASALRCLE